MRSMILQPYDLGNNLDWFLCLEADDLLLCLASGAKNETLSSRRLTGSSFEISNIGTVEHNYRSEQCPAMSRLRGFNVQDIA
jgi:hypothetical protein